MSVSRDHLLRTFASVPPGARVLDLQTRALADLARLGFDVWASSPTNVDDDRQRLAEVLGEAEAERRVTPARLDALGYPDGYFDWAALSLASGDDGIEILREVRRVIEPGAWVWVFAEDLTEDALAALAEEAELVVAEVPRSAGDGSHGIFRRVESGVHA